MDNTDWTLYRSFLHVMREGSLSGAARVLDLAQPTLGRQIQALEASLKTRLFTRSQTGLQPTDAAQALLPHAQAMESIAAAAQRTAADHSKEISGTVRLTASEVMGMEVLPPILKSLRQRYPELRVELVLSNDVQDLLHRQADIAVRMVRPHQERLIARRIGTVDCGLHAARDYLKRYGLPRCMDDLRRHTVIGPDRMSPALRTLVQRWPQLDPAHLALRTDSDLAQLSLIRAGAGIGICQAPLAARTPPLTRLLAQEFNLPLETWVVMHEDLRHHLRCSKVFEALVHGLGEYLDNHATAAAHGVLSTKD
ncbi:LysR family transcriptional regulator [Herbaspirillum rubrisubalbicans]|uniref:LysR family transcriptional regulator n=1 Tax=Herbaspirillum rubrisubalbicans TaxID=80842 RepID=A0AAD0XEV2_9BURK|nr:LysR family transcriptional regulator [Herbaspirillum rubrisubalbicans]AYR23481.1 LysR family transcriptional regulator [Herbaspirillum rubrisubalbicans]